MSWPTAARPRSTSTVLSSMFDVSVQSEFGGDRISNATTSTTLCLFIHGTRVSTTVQAKTTIVSEPAQGNRVYTVAGRHTQHELERAALLVHTKNSVQAYYIKFGKMCAYITALFWSKWLQWYSDVKITGNSVIWSNCSETVHLFYVRDSNNQHLDIRDTQLSARSRIVVNCRKYRDAPKNSVCAIWCKKLWCGTQCSHHFDRSDGDTEDYIIYASYQPGKSQNFHYTAI